LLARFALGRLIALKLKRQADAVLGYALATSCKPSMNGESRFLKEVGNGIKSFVDVGANRGEWTEQLLRLAPGAKGVLYEPGREALEILRLRFANNSLLTIRPLGCSDKDANLLFNEVPGAGETSTFVLGASPSCDGLAKIEVRRLDRDLIELGVETVDLLKIDAEGFDYRVLVGAGRLIEQQRIGLLQFEYNTSWANEGSTLLAALSYLKRSGYVVFAIRADGVWRMDSLDLGEYFRYSNFLAARHDWLGRLSGIVRGDVGELFRLW
jgi:FkbM family methyltransferase